MNLLWFQYEVFSCHRTPSWTRVWALWTETSGETHITLTHSSTSCKLVGVFSVHSYTHRTCLYLLLLLIFMYLFCIMQLQSVNVFQTQHLYNFIFLLRIAFIGRCQLCENLSACLLLIIVQTHTHTVQYTSWRLSVLSGAGWSYVGGAHPWLGICPEGFICCVGEPVPIWDFQTYWGHAQHGDRGIHFPFIYALIIGLVFIFWYCHVGAVSRFG